jgi:hypothetical protein
MKNNESEMHISVNEGAASFVTRKSKREVMMMMRDEMR